MRHITFIAASLLSIVPSVGSAQQVTQPNIERRRLSPDMVREASPALEAYTQDKLYGEVWRRPGLSPRDRSLVSVSALIARGEAPALSYYGNQAIENGVKPAELSETITQLAFYAGWGEAMAAAGAMREIFKQRGVTPAQLPPADAPLLPFDAAKDAPRAATVAPLRSTSPGVIDYTNDLLFRDLWRRPGLAPRDRSLVTIAALVAGGHAEQLPYHVKRGLDVGLTPTELGEALTQLAFYAGFPNAFAALPVVKKAIADHAAAK